MNVELAKGFIIDARFCYGDELFLKPIFDEIPPYIKKMNKVKLHIDKASSHSFKSSATYLAEKESQTGKKYKTEIYDLYMIY